MEREATGLDLELGEQAPYFSLKGIDGKIYSTADFKAAEALVVIFTCNHCPYAQAYEQRLIELANTYAARGVQFVAICSNDSVGYPQDDFQHMVEKSEQLGLTFPYLHDETQIAAKAYDAQCTPEVYVFNHEQCLAYHGRIDDNYQEPEQVTTHDLRDALDAVLSREPVATPFTPAIGCSIKWKR